MKTLTLQTRIQGSEKECSKLILKIGRLIEKHNSKLVAENRIHKVDAYPVSIRVFELHRLVKIEVT